MSEADAELAARGEVGEALADGERIGDFAAVVVDEHGHRLVREDLVVHLRRPDRGAGIADEGVGHRAVAPLIAEVVGGRIGRVADEADGAGLLLRRLRADACRIGHHLGHFDACAVARVHRQEGDPGQAARHGVGVVGGDAGGAQPLEVERFQIDQMAEGAREIHQGLAGADPLAFLELAVGGEHGAALGRDRLQPLDHQAGREADRPPQKQRVGDPGVAEAGRSSCASA